MSHKISPGPLVFLILFALITLVLCLVFWPFIHNLRDPLYREQFSSWVEGLGLRGFFLLFGLQVLQILIAIIPGEPVELLAGAAYGALGGLGICLLGCVFASSLIFLLVRKFGSPRVIRFLRKDAAGTYTFLYDTPKIVRVVFILFLIPGTPKDVLTYIVPLSKLKAYQFILISAFARIPSILTSTIMGDSLIQGNWRLFLLIFLITALIGFLGILVKERIIEACRSP
jgi:uncharacterized membrane protein YdjX (TVP38/TMEM64 family)